MANAVPFLLQGKNIILVIDNKSHTISKDTHMNYGKIVDALKAKDWDALPDLVEPKKAIVKFGSGYVTIVNSEVLWKGQPFHNALSSRMIEMYMEGFPIEPMIKLMENLMQNPSKRSVDQFYGFLEKNNLPITEDGHFLAFKKVRHNFRDVHTGTMDNSVGKVVEMPRNLVDDNPEATCSSGLHFCSESYLNGFGDANGPVMILKINPADVVSIPVDYNGAKGRCCKFTVVGQVTGDPKTAFNSVVNNDYSPKPAATPVWPFPGAAPTSSECVGNCGSCNCGNDDDEDNQPLAAYDVVRVYGGKCEATGLSLSDARDLVAKNVRQKKAMLKVVISGTTTPV